MPSQEPASIFLLRHGEAAGGARYRGVTDDPLSPAGWQQMWAATHRISPPRRVVTSPLARCAEFAHAYADRHGLTLRVEERLREIDFGAWEGHRAEEIEKIFPNAIENFYRAPWTFGPPGGEPMNDMWMRVLAAWEDLSPEAPVLVVTHGGPIRALLCYVLGCPREQIGTLDVPHGSIHRLTVPSAGRIPAADGAAI